ncbi:probable LRR receptor-like serine/threonine-protein kinase At3g47570 [Tripterygium wilfordii]|uniref:probable LRR receptor-like serine/threonine-protein kinase At3g47570 n=1 Tax=Tripterygium wilfordii TaxID=458696 RepID=UPI0018F7E646|nr:probable LRR receptor-like serine/threonine-protein kinase At3g47570 [Tripterygium wilfordii]
MKKSCSSCSSILSVLVHGFLFLSLIANLGSAAIPTSPNVTELSALLDFKEMIDEDPHQLMSSWNDSIHFCNWVGVTCDSSDGRIVLLNLASRGLAGRIPPSIGNLTFLTEINITSNSFHGEIPQEMGRLLRLQTMDLSSNTLGGRIPANLTHCTGLRAFHMMYNELVGQIPDQLSTLSKLEVLNLGFNDLTGNIPTWIGNFSSLQRLFLSGNNFQGSIPDELGHLSNLGSFQVSQNNLSGMIPSSIYNISSLYGLVVAQNKLHGQLPLDIGLTLPKLKAFLGPFNSFTGPIPESFSNASGLERLDFRENGLTGTISGSLGSLKNLIRLNFHLNSLRGDLSFLSDLANSTTIEVLGLSSNFFTGELPSSIANLSVRLKELSFGGNLLHGNIPVGIGNLVDLTGLGFEKNNLGGSIPEGIGHLHKLEGLFLFSNRFSGLIPSSLSNLTKLAKLYMDDNRLEGSIPASLGKCTRLQDVYFSRNYLSGTIPKQILGLPSLSIALDMSYNSLIGSLPLEVGNLNNLMELDVSHNRLSGRIPSTLSSCTSLEHLHLEGNTFDGTIPQSLETLKGLVYLDLSQNNLSGQLPVFLSKFSSLWYLNLSNNDFEGEVPQGGVFANASAIFITGNDKLCGGIAELRLQKCVWKRDGKHLSTKVITVVTISAIFAFGLMCSLATICVLKNKRSRATAPPSIEWEPDMSFLELMKSTNGFSVENLIGSGSFGSVYKGILPGCGKSIAVKVLNLQQPGALKSFIDECNALRNIRHRNLLKVITACSSIDHQGHEFKALVFEFMSNGNLDQWLHPIPDVQYQVKKLSLIQRLNIAINVASALDYLHYHCDTPIVHCDLKPSNVLLDENMTAHVGDFGLTRFLSEASKDQTISVGLKGSIGYIPPEYGLGDRVTVLGDIYSYGILLLEMFTGKRPTDDMFENNTSIREFVAMALPEHVMGIADPTVLFGEEDHGAQFENKTQVSNRCEIQECLVSVMRIGLVCSAPSPGNRIAMNAVVNKLNTIKDAFVGSKNRRWRRF